jgi:hypothetical protein
VVGDIITRLMGVRVRSYLERGLDKYFYEDIIE